jgi:hypothetical protein
MREGAYPVIVETVQGAHMHMRELVDQALNGTLAEEGAPGEPALEIPDVRTAMSSIEVFGSEETLRKWATYRSKGLELTREINGFRSGTGSSQGVRENQALAGLEAKLAELKLAEDDLFRQMRRDINGG